MKRRIGIYTGTFDPIHEGHLAFSREAVRSCSLDRVIIIPEASPREKPNATDINTRLSLIQQATIAHDHIETMSLETPRFTVKDALPEMEQRFTNADLTLLIGSDIVRTLLYRWEGLPELFARTSLAIGMRDGETLEDMQFIIAELENQYALSIHATYIQTEYSAVSSSIIRKNKSMDFA
ncbi:MAG TPA: adenylyltransferase/cytidyltransferase family protein [Candidatus Saccharimonadales bacterium]|nr:adenylyltransferase/cytidyltransferase family protein [Candidatus Saccharimonadales bacterium]